MGLEVAADNAAANAVAGVSAFMSLHSANPGPTGANELAGGAPAYARKAVTWTGAVTGIANLNGDKTFDVPAGSTVAYVGLWSALSGGTFYGSDDVTPEVFAAQGTYVVTGSGGSPSNITYTSP